MPDEADEDALARDMIEVHGAEASGVARANARTAALARDTSALAADTLRHRWVMCLASAERYPAPRHVIADFSG